MCAFMRTCACAESECDFPRTGKVSGGTMHLTQWMCSLPLRYMRVRARGLGVIPLQNVEVSDGIVDLMQSVCALSLRCVRVYTRALVCVQV